MSKKFNLCYLFYAKIKAFVIYYQQPEQIMTKILQSTDYSASFTQRSGKVFMNDQSKLFKSWFPQIIVGPFLSHI